MTLPADLAARLAAHRLVPVVILDDPELGVPLAQCLLRAGLGVIEITFRTAAAATAIRAVRAACPDMVVGAGTLLTPAQVEAARTSGAHFGVAPGTNDRVLAAAAAAGLPFIPGIATASELEHALALGCSLLKFFPAQAIGGLPLLSALTGTYRHTGVRFMPTGGIDEASLGAWLAVASVAAVGGSWFVDPTLIRARDWSEIERRTRAALAIAAARAPAPALASSAPPSTPTRAAVATAAPATPEPRP
jgi:2-dehydro-3-deoxyphosphogluconate aldolase/(4S)-4-hydroxy-2-oxoglutarate aldolase